MTDYQPFPISNARTGFNQSLEPWLLPRDGYQVMINAHLYRGVLEKIEGYTLFAPFTYRNLLSLGVPDGVTTNFAGVLPTLPISSNFFVYGTIVAGSSAETFIYDSDASPTVINLIGNTGGSGTVDITTGAYSITFNTAPPAGLYSSVLIAWDSVPTTLTAIMGIKQYYDINGSQDVLVFDQRRMGKIVENIGVLAETLAANNIVSEIPHSYYQDTIFVGTGAIALFTGVLNGAPFVPGTLRWTEYTSAFVPTGRAVIDNGVGGLIGITGTAVTSGSINYVTGAYTITFAAAVPTGNYWSSSLGIYGDLFSGSISNFFSLTNYQAKAFFCNNVNNIFYYDGVSIKYLPAIITAKKILATAGVPSNLDISKCLHVFTNRERLLLISPTTANIPEVNNIRWSTAGDPLNFTNGEFLLAPTSEPIRAIGYINSDLVVRFSNSERVFRYTSDAFSPFRWDSTNNIWACDAPYGTINYDSWFSSVGKPAIVGSDGVNVKRADDNIPDFTDPSRLAQQTPIPFMNQTSIIQCYGERFDDMKEGWLCYNSLPENEAEVTPSDNVLAFNYLDNTYAVYNFPFSCLGFGKLLNALTWGTTYTKWEDYSDTWDSYQATNSSLVDLAGDQFDKVYELNSGYTLGDDITPITFSVITKNFNPFIEDGELCRFGYVDLFISAEEQSTLRVQFYLNDQLYIDSNDEPAGYYQESVITLNPKDAMSPTTNQTKVWKRIYVGAVAKTHTIRFYQKESDLEGNPDQPIYIHAMVLYMKPAGRIYN